MRFLIALLMFTLTGCKYDETISGYVDQRAEWALVELDGKPFPARATIAFPAKGKITGQAPCNRYSATQSAPRPWFEAGPVISTKMACSDLAAEQQFFKALEEMTLMDVLGNVLVLSNDTGREMVFNAVP
ncbi:META domain-containing protein [Profundibacter sp.]|uniref:META domain-containing protein n=1 Tax=Profundibacter sp. TaxID=3101071 RepID=UPI003D14E400